MTTPKPSLEDILQEEDHAISHRALTDILLSGFFALGVFAVSVATDAFEAFVEYSRAHEDFELDEIFMFVLALGLGACFYAWRRVIDLRRVLRRRIAADQAGTDHAAQDAQGPLPDRAH